MNKAATQKAQKTRTSFGYTFVISLYCTLMVWSAFVSIDRHIAFAASTASAASAAPIAGATR